MSLEQWIMVGLGVLGFLLHAGVTLVTVSRWLFNMKADLGREISDHKLGVSAQVSDAKSIAAAALATLRAQMEDAMQEVRDHTAESITAIRTKVGEIELWGRDNYVKKDSFAVVIDRIEGNHEKMGEKIEGRLEKMDEKLDRLSEQLGRK